MSDMARLLYAGCRGAEKMLRRGGARSHRTPLGVEASSNLEFGDGEDVDEVEEAEEVLR